MAATVTLHSPVRVVAFLSMQLGTAAMLVFAAHLPVFLLAKDTTIVLIISGISMVIFYLFILIKFIKKAHTWKETAEYWTTYDVDLSRKNALGALLFLAAAIVGSVMGNFPLWPEICGGLTLLSISWLIVWQLARNERT